MHKKSFLFKKSLFYKKIGYATLCFGKSVLGLIKQLS